MRAYVESLPQRCLLTLHTTEAGPYPLAAALRQALHSTQSSVWVDCRYVSKLPAGALRLLRRCASRLWRRGGHLVLCHLPEAARAEITIDASQPLAASMLDAAHYGLAWPADTQP